MSFFYSKKNIMFCITSYILLTAFIFIICMQFISIDIDIETNNNGMIQLYYNNQSGNESYFDEQHSEIKKIEVNKNNQTITFSKSLNELEKIRIDFKQIKEISLNKITIKSCGISILKFTSNDINQNFNLKYSTELKEQDNKLVVKVLSEPSYIGIDNMPIMKVKFGVIIMALIIAAIILSFLLKTLMKNMSMQKIFIALVMFILISPVLIFNIIVPNDNSTNENRTLKDRPELKLNTISKYPLEFGEYFDDHIPFKQSIVKLNSYLKYYLLSVSPKDYVVKGKDNWLFYNSKAREETDSIGDYLGTTHYTEEELRLIKDKLVEKQKYFADKGIEFYVMLCPNKEQIYYEYMPEYYIKQNTVSKLDELASYLEKESEIKIVYVKDKILENKNKNNLLYYKWDTHWNLAGGYIGFYELMKSMNREHGIPSYDEIDFLKYERPTGDLSNMINMTPSGKDYDYSAQNYKNDIRAEVSKKENNTTYYKSDSQNKEKILVYRDSFGEALIPYISKNFNESIFTADRNLDYNFIEKEKPNIVVFEVVERGIEVLKN